MIAKIFRFAKAFQRAAMKSLLDKIRFAIMPGAALFYVIKYETRGLGAIGAVENFGVCLDLGSSV